MDMPKRRKKKCFVISPIGKDESLERKHAEEFLLYIVKDTLERTGFNFLVQRSDEISSPDMINDRVFKEILDSDLIVADITSHNPNVFYELAFAHVAMKRTIVCATFDTAIPFDMGDFRVLRYRLGESQFIKNARRELGKYVREAFSERYVVNNPIVSSITHVSLRQLTEWFVPVPDYDAVEDFFQKKGIISREQLIARALYLYEILISAVDNGKEVIRRDTKTGSESSLQLSGNKENE